jgi:hypothetical protein
MGWMGTVLARSFLMVQASGVMQSIRFKLDTRKAGHSEHPLYCPFVSTASRKVRKSSKLSLRQTLLSSHRGNDELYPFLGPGWPTRRYGFGLGIKADRVRAVLIEVTEARPLPPAEGIV